MGKINTNSVIGVNIKTKDFINFDILNEVTNSGFDKCKVGTACRTLCMSHRGYVWFYKDQFNNDILNLKLSLIRAPKRKKQPFSDNKICHICQQNKRINEFHKEKTGVHGVRGECKKCQHTRMNNRKKTDLLYRLKQNLRKRLNASLKVKTWHKTSTFNEYIGCSLNKLKNHLESLFKVGMTWNNYGEWQIDHIIPLSSAKTEIQLYKLSHYMNLQPLWKYENIQKGGKYQTPRV